MSNPYCGKHLGECLLLFFQRMGEWLFGSLTFGQLATDEIQILTLAALALSSALVGSFLVLKKMTMLANSLSHTILPGLVIVFLLGKMWAQDAPFSVADMSLGMLFSAALATAILTALAILACKHLFRLKEDASIGLISTLMVAFGVVLVTIFTKSAHLGIEAVMGNVDALHPHDLKNLSQIALFDLLLILPFFTKWKLIAFDAGFAKTQGVSTLLWDTLLLFLTALTVASAFRAVGILLVLSFLVGPVLIARLFSHRLHHLILWAALIGALLSLLGVLLSRHILSYYCTPLSTAGIVSTLIAAIYFLCRSIRRFC